MDKLFRYIKGIALLIYFKHFACISDLTQNKFTNKFIEFRYIILKTAWYKNLQDLDFLIEHFEFNL